MIFDRNAGHLSAKYPFKVDPGVLINNGNEALACQKSQEKRQLKNGTHTQYVEQFQDMLDRGVVEEISSQETEQYSGPVNWITHHEVHKPGSLSTPVRLVSNSSFRNGKTNLNDLTIKDPNTLADLFGNLLKFRGYKIGLVYNITKAYYSMRSGLIEKHV